MYVEEQLHLKCNSASAAAKPKGDHYHWRRNENSWVAVSLGCSIYHITYKIEYLLTNDGSQIKLTSMKCALVDKFNKPSSFSLILLVNQRLCGIEYGEHCQNKVKSSCSCSILSQWLYGFLGHWFSSSRTFYVGFIRRKHKKNKLHSIYLWCSCWLYICFFWCLVHRIVM